MSAPTPPTQPRHSWTALIATGLIALGSLGTTSFGLVACGGDTEVVKNLHLRITSDAPTGGGSLENLGILFAKGDTTYPASPADPAFNPSLTGLDPTSSPVLISLKYDGLTFGDGADVTLQVVGRTGQVVRTRFEGVVDLDASRIIELRLKALPDGCDTDGDGFLDCTVAGCCDPSSPFGDCDDDSIGSNPWASAPACIPCGQTFDFDCDGTNETCTDADNDTIADCEETCGAGDSTVGPGLPELCDDKDNDCDSTTDEGFELAGTAVGGACTAAGECGVGVVECKTTSTVTCSTAPDGSDSQVEAEVCDAQDNDCDGSTDEDFEHEGLSMGAACEGLGECGSGIVECAVFRTDLATCSTNPNGTETTFVPETCDDLDNDCDGETDEGLTLADSSCKQVGVCLTGIADLVATCSNEGTWTCDYTEVANYQDEETLCDGLDNDCDGTTDEGFLYGSIEVGEACDGVGSCGAGTVVCATGGATATCSTNPDGPDNQATTEACDGADNDCDGTTDEGFSFAGQDVGEACDGIGQCGAGVVQCTTDGSNVGTCSTNPNGSASQAVAELCDDLDNDCDGNTDEGLGLAQSPCLVVGVCGQNQGSIVATCTDGTWACDYSAVPNYQATETRCDNRDNDCDSTTDEGFTYAAAAIGQACDGVGACGAGTVQCAVGSEDTATCSTNPDGSASQVVTESCDTLDNDCDASTDEGFTYLGTAIGLACNGVGECGAGLVECLDATTATCSTNLNGSEPDDSPETCNDLDDDCDGNTDEGLTLADSNCLNVGVCAVGFQSIVATCTPEGTWSCNYSAVNNYQAIETLCDSLDNDCDSQTDEPFKAGGTVTYTDPQYAPNSNLLLGAACGTGLCSGGAVICNAANRATMVCDTVVQNRRAELCDDADDDCDGQTDETFTGLLTALNPADVGRPKNQSCGSGLCEDGTVVCNEAGSALVCDSDPDAIAEACNGGDDDCDGNVDEGFPDADGDQIADCVDTCTDTDFDGVCTDSDLLPCASTVNEGCSDNCPDTDNPTQIDSDRDGKGDVCDLACPAGPGPFEVCGDCLDNNCSGASDEVGCAERRIITVVAKNEALPVGYPVKLTFDHKTLVDAGWSTTSGDDVRVFYRDPTLPCDDGDPLSCSVELDRVADPLKPFNEHDTELWFALQAPLDANAATTAYEVYYNVDAMLGPLADAGAVFHAADLFDRDPSDTLGQGWVDASAVTSDFAVANNALTVNYTDDGEFTPQVTLPFDTISAASLTGQFELRLGMNWTRTTENDFAVIMQLGKASALAAMPDQDERWPNDGVGVSLAYGGGASIGGLAVNTLATSAGGVSTAVAFSSRAVFTGLTEVYVTVDFESQGGPSYAVTAGNGLSEDASIPFTTAQTELDTLRFVLHNVSNNFTSKAWRHVIMRPTVGLADEPSVYLGIEEPLGSGLASCTLGADRFLRYAMNERVANQAQNNALDTSNADTAINLTRSQVATSPDFIELLSHWAARFTVIASGGRYLSPTQSATSKLQSRLHGRSSLTYEIVVDNNDPATSGSTQRWVALVADGDHTNTFGLAFLDNDSVEAVVRTAAGTTATWRWDAPPIATSRRLVLHLVFDSTRATASERLRLYVDGALRAAAASPAIAQNANIFLYNGSGASPGNSALFAVGNRTVTSPASSPLADIYWVAAYARALSAEDVRSHTRILLKSDDAP